MLASSWPLGWMPFCPDYNMNGHRPILQDLRSASSRSNLFFFIRFRTLCTPRSAFNPFGINNFRTLSRATEGAGIGSDTQSFSMDVLCFQSLPTIKFCNFFPFKLLQQCPGVGGSSFPFLRTSASSASLRYHFFSFPDPPLVYPEFRSSSFELPGPANLEAAFSPYQAQTESHENHKTAQAQYPDRVRLAVQPRSSI